MLKFRIFERRFSSPFPFSVAFLLVWWFNKLETSSVCFFLRVAAAIKA